MPTSAPPAVESTALAKDRLGIPAVLFFIISAMAPMTVVAGVVTTMYAITGLSAIGAAFVAVALVLALFAVGYVAMARHITNAGALYAYVARGLGRPVGVGAALVAALAYNALQVGLYGMFGPTLAGYLADKVGLDLPWWVWSLGAWLLVAVLGVLRVDLNGRVLGVLLSAEVAVLLVLTVAGLSDPAAGLPLNSLSPDGLFGHAGVGALLVTALLGYVGFEAAAVFSEEARVPGRTVPVAIYTSLARPGGLGPDGPAVLLARHHRCVRGAVPAGRHLDRGHPVLRPRPAGRGCLAPPGRPGSGRPRPAHHGLGRPGQLLHPPRRRPGLDRGVGVPGRLRRRRGRRHRLRPLAALGPPQRLPGHRPGHRHLAALTGPATAIGTSPTRRPSETNRLHGRGRSASVP
jgi:hypothetical protein